MVRATAVLGVAVLLMVTGMAVSIPAAEGTNQDKHTTSKDVTKRTNTAPKPNETFRSLVHPVNAEDHRPGTNASLELYITTNRTISMDGTLHWMVLKSEGFVLNQCNTGDLRAEGIDRGNDDPGVEADESIIDNRRETYETEDTFSVSFYQDSTEGPTTHFTDEDELVASFADCWGTPEDPGWYRWDVKWNGTTSEGEKVESEHTTHWIWICDCESEEDARNELGPPPSEREDTPTETEADGETPTETDALDETSTATEADGETPTETVDPDETSTDTDAPNETPTVTEADGDTPMETDTPEGTPTGQPGFGLISALVGMLVVALLVSKRQ